MYFDNNALCFCFRGSRLLGTNVVMMYNMLWNDMGKFGFIFVLFLSVFSIGNHFECNSVHVISKLPLTKITAQ